MFDRNILDQEIMMSEAGVRRAQEALNELDQDVEASQRATIEQRLARATARNKTLNNALAVYEAAAEYRTVATRLIAEANASGTRLDFEALREPLRVAHERYVDARLSELQAQREHGIADGLAAQVIVETRYHIDDTEQLVYRG